jgi:hypothetical protein
MSCNYCWPGNCCGGPGCARRRVDSGDPRMRLTLKDMAQHMPPVRLENPHLPLPDVSKESNRARP